MILFQMPYFQKNEQELGINNQGWNNKLLAKTFNRKDSIDVSMIKHHSQD